MVKLGKEKQKKKKVSKEKRRGALIQIDGGLEIIVSDKDARFVVDFLCRNGTGYFCMPIDLDYFEKYGAYLYFPEGEKDE